MDRAAQDFLKEIFGKDYEYNITDGQARAGKEKAKAEKRVPIGN